jgi:hypothetical protein
MDTSQDQRLSKPQDGLRLGSGLATTHYTQVGWKSRFITSDRLYYKKAVY